MVVAAAGNGQGAVTRPANCRGVVAVAALNRDGFKAHYSNFGPEVTLATVGGDDVGGPMGTLIADGGLLTLYNSGVTAAGEHIYARSFGTSFATPIVAGTAALMLSANPGLTVDQVIAGLAASARPHVRSPWLASCSADNSASLPVHHGHLRRRHARCRAGAVLRARPGRLRVAGARRRGARQPRARGGVAGARHRPRRSRPTSARPTPPAPARSARGGCSGSSRRSAPSADDPPRCALRG